MVVVVVDRDHKWGTKAVALNISGVFRSGKRGEIWISFCVVLSDDGLCVVLGLSP